MTNFEDLTLQTRILLALAGLKQEMDESYFTTGQISGWLEKRLEKFSERSFVRKLQQMRQNNSLKVSDDKGSPMGEVNVLSCTDNRPYLYKIGPSTAETQFSAKLLNTLRSRTPDGGGLPIDIEEAVVDEIFEEFKGQARYSLSDRKMVAKKIDEAIGGLYFVRDSDGLLRPTRRLTIDEHDFIENLSRSLPPPIKK